MTAWARRIAGGALALASVLVLVALSRFPQPVDDAAELRLSWRLRAPLEEECRRLTDAEREALPVHMRRDVVCEGRVASYALELKVNGEPVRAATVRGAGARGDRPLFVYDALRLPPGHYDVEVVFEKLSGVAGAGEDAGDGRLGGGSGVPDRLELTERVHLEAGAVALVTFDAAERRLVLRRTVYDHE